MAAAKSSYSRSLAAGLVGGLALLLHNPVPHMLFAAPWLITFALRPDTRRQLIPLVAGYLPAIAVGFEWAWLRSDIAPAAQGAAAMDAALRSVFILPDADILNMRVAAAAKMCVWALPCLFYFALLGYLRARDRWPLRLLTLSAVSTFAGYLLINLDQGHGWGYRYFQPAWGIIPILAACALIGRSDTEHGLVTFAGASAILSLLILIPFQLMQIDHFITGHLAMLPPIKRPGGNVYFIDWRGGYYLGDMVQADPLLRSEDLYLATQGAQADEQLIARNWPSAVKCGAAPGVVQWCTGKAHAGDFH